MGDIADDLIDAGYSDYEHEPGDHFWCGSPRARLPKCSNADVHNIVKNIVARKNQKPIAREILDKHVAEIAKIRFNQTPSRRVLLATIDDLLNILIVDLDQNAVKLYQQIALCAILLAEEAEKGKW